MTIFNKDKVEQLLSRGHQLTDENKVLDFYTRTKQGQEIVNKTNDIYPIIPDSSIFEEVSKDELEEKLQRIIVAYDRATSKYINLTYPFLILDIEFVKCINSVIYNDNPDILKSEFEISPDETQLFVKLQTIEEDALTAFLKTKSEIILIMEQIKKELRYYICK